ncbi:hypothetical protein [Marinoscillum sp.]|uniref:hypothetical protein n=1 Tax=Marinoscillum sp. TaxID=2024838 RepID=UPI003BA8D161
MRFILLAIILLGGVFRMQAQETPAYDSLRREILALRVDVNDINLRMKDSKSRFQSGILVSTLGYSTVIAGGLMLGRERDQLGQTLLVTGGVTGLVGTYLLTDAFRVLAGKRKQKKP